MSFVKTGSGQNEYEYSRMNGRRVFRFGRTIRRRYFQAGPCDPRLLRDGQLCDRAELTGEKRSSFYRVPLLSNDR